MSHSSETESSDNYLSDISLAEQFSDGAQQQPQYNPKGAAMSQQGGQWHMQAQQQQSPIKSSSINGSSEQGGGGGGGGAFDFDPRGKQQQQTQQAQQQQATASTSTRDRAIARGLLRNPNKGSPTAGAGPGIPDHALLGLSSDSQDSSGSDSDSTASARRPLLRRGVRGGENSSTGALGFQGSASPAAGQRRAPGLSRGTSSPALRTKDDGIASAIPTAQDNAELRVRGHHGRSAKHAAKHGGATSLAGGDDRGGSGSGSGGGALQRVKRVFLRAIETIPIQQPTSTHMLTWNAVVCAAVLWSVITLPFRIGFRDLFSEHYHGWHIMFLLVDYVGDIIFWTDILLNFRTAYMDHGIVHDDSEKVAKRYLRDWLGGFPRDLLATLPYGLAVIDVLWLHALMRLPRLLRFPMLSEAMSRIEMHTRHAHTVLGVKLLLGILLFLHVVCCFYIALAYFYGFGGGEWGPPEDMEDANPLSVYLFGIFWALKIMSGLGGEVPPPENDGERFFNFVVAFISLIYQSAIVGYIVNLISAVNQNTEEFRAKMSAVNLYMKNKRVDPTLADKIRAYYNHMWSRQGGVDDETTLDDMPLRLRTELALGINKDVINGVPFFKDCNPGFIHALVTLLRPEVYIPGDAIMSQGDLGTDMYFISQGLVNIVIDGNKVAQMGEGRFFGEIALLYECPRTATIIADNYCDVFVLRKDDLDKVLNSFPEQAVIIRAQANRGIAKDSLNRFMASHTLFKDILSDAEQQAAFQEELLSHFQFMPVKAGGKVYGAGEDSGFLHVLCMGSVELANLSSMVSVTKDTNADKSSFELCGEVDFLLNRERTQSCLATTDCVFMTLSQENFRKTLRKYLKAKLTAEGGSSPTSPEKESRVRFAQDDATGAVAGLVGAAFGSALGADVVDSLQTDQKTEELVVAQRKAMARRAGSMRRGAWTRALKAKLRAFGVDYRSEQKKRDAAVRTRSLSRGGSLSASETLSLRESSQLQTKTSASNASIRSSRRGIARSAIVTGRGQQGEGSGSREIQVPAAGQSSQWYRRFSQSLASEGGNIPQADILRSIIVLSELAAQGAQAPTPRR